MQLNLLIWKYVYENNKTHTWRIEYRPPKSDYEGRGKGDKITPVRRKTEPSTPFVSIYVKKGYFFVCWYCNLLWRAQTSWRINIQLVLYCTQHRPQFLHPPSSILYLHILLCSMYSTEFNIIAFLFFFCPY